MNEEKNKKNFWDWNLLFCSDQSVKQSSVRPSDQLLRPAGLQGRPLTAQAGGVCPAESSQDWIYVFTLP